MDELRELVKRPLFFEKNRVYRVYLGGKGFDALTGDGSVDGLFPEEWLCSAVKAINPVYYGPRDGVSVVEGTDVFFDDLLKAYPDELTGGRRYDCLVKYLDSAIRLPVQVHPTKEFSRKHFGSPYGKTEAWLVAGTRPGAKIYFGFNRAVTKKELSDLERRSLNERDVMAGVLASVPARIGDVYLITAGMIHAIGAGCTIIEIQEPTDFTIQPENWCGEVRIGEKEKYIGLDKDTALDCFDFSFTGDRAIAKARMTPRTVLIDKGYRKETLITYDDTPCFAENRHTLSGGSFVPDYGPAVYAVLDGNAVLTGDNYRRTVKKGEYFFLPFAARNRFSVSGNAVLVECLPSRQE